MRLCNRSLRMASVFSMALEWLLIACVLPELSKGSPQSWVSRRILLNVRKRYDDRLRMPRSLGWGQYKASLKEKKDVLTSRDKDELPEGWTWDRYHNSTEVGSMLEFLSSRFPSIASTYSIGKSIQGKPLVAIKVGEAADLSKENPGVKLVGSMHGDEAAACELLLRLAWDLCRRHNSTMDSLGVRRLLQTTSLYILPVMNPDGYDAQPRSRTNSAGMDLNRGFPRLGDTAARAASSRGGSGGSMSSEEEAALEPEVQAVMQWTLKHNFPLSANLHGGYLVASYPFDACDRHGLRYNCPTPEDPTPYHLARHVSLLHPRMAESDFFPGGVTRGSEWYPLLGGMQDWVWFATQGTELTFEVHESKEPDDRYRGRLRWLYLEWRDPLLQYVASVHHSFQGIVLDAKTDEPLKSEILLSQLQDSDQGSAKGRTTDIRAEDRGSFIRVLTPGLQYCFRVAAVPASGFETHYGVLQLMQGKPADASARIFTAFKLGRGKLPVVHFIGAASGWPRKKQRRAAEVCRKKLLPTAR